MCKMEEGKTRDTYELSLRMLLTSCQLLSVSKSVGLGFHAEMKNKFEGSTLKGIDNASS
jgi:hypothetical protein